MATGLNLATATPAQLAQYANQIAASESHAAAQPILNQEGSNAAQYAAQGHAIQGFSTALAQLLGQVAPQVQNTYQQAANSQAAFGKGFSDAIQNQIGQNADANNSFLQQMGAPQSAIHPAANVGDVTYGLGGYIPASTMNREGAAFTAAAQLLPGNATAQGQQDLMANDYAGQAAQAKLQDQVAQVMAKQPQLANTEINSLMSQQTRQQQLQVTQRKNAIDEITRYGVDPSSGKLTPYASQLLEQLTGAPAGTFTGMDAKTAASISEHAQTIAQENARLTETERHNRIAENQGAQRIAVQIATQQAKGAPKFNPSASKALGYRSDQYGNPLGNKVRLLPGFSFNSGGQIVKSATGGKQHGLTQAQINRAKGTALTLAQTAFEGGVDSKGNALPKLTYQQAVLEAQKEGLPAWIYLPALNSFYEPGGLNSPMAGPPAPGRRG